MAQETTVAVKINASTGGTESVKSLKAQIREAVNEATLLAQKFGEFSPEATKAAQRVAQLKDEMDDFKQRVEGLNPDKFQTIGRVVQGVAGGIQAAQGAMALFGSESENLQKSLLKVQGAMALAQGVQGLMDLKNVFGALATAAVQSFATIKAAIMSSGIGAITLLVGAIAVAVAALMQKKEKVKELSQAQKSLNAINENYSKIIEDQYSKSLAQISILKDTNMSMKDRKTALVALQKEYPDYLKNLNIETASSKELKQQTDDLTNAIYRRAKAEAAMTELTKIAGKELTLEMSLIGKATDAQIKEQRKQLAAQGLTQAQIDKQMKMNVSVQAGLNKKAEQELEQTRKAKEQILGFLKETQQVSATISKGNVENAKGETKDLEQEALIRQAALLAVNADTYEKQIAAADAQFLTTVKNLKEQGYTEIEIGILRDANLEKIRKEYLDKKAQDEKNATAKEKAELAERKAAREKFIEDSKAITQKEIADTFAATDKLYANKKNQLTLQGATQAEFDNLEIQRLEAQLQNAKDYGELTKDETLRIEAELFAKKKEMRDKDLANQRAAEAASIELTKQGFATLAQLADTFAGKSEEQQRRAFQIKKIASIAQTLIETYQAAQSAYASQMTIPTPEAPIRAAVAAGIAIASGLARVAAIQKTKFEGGGGGNPGGGNGSIPNAPQTTPLTGGTLPDTEAGQFAGMGKVYVLEGDITKTQTRVRRVRNVSVV